VIRSSDNELIISEVRHYLSITSPTLR